MALRSRGKEEAKWRPISKANGGQYLSLRTFTHHRLSIYWRILSLSRHAADRQNTFISFHLLLSFSIFFFLVYLVLPYTFISFYLLLSFSIFFFLVYLVLPYTFISFHLLLSFFISFFLCISCSSFFHFPFPFCLSFFVSFASLLVNSFLLFSTNVYIHSCNRAQF